MIEMLDPKSLTVFITGATSGFGAALARRYAEAGAKVVITGRRKKRLDALRDELGERLYAVVLDVRDQAAVEAAVAGLPEDFASVNVLINNAGLALGLSPADSAEIGDWDTMVDTNIKGLLYVTRAVLSGTELLDFKRQLIDLKGIEPGAALADLEQLPEEIEEPSREIEKIAASATAD